MDRIKVQLPNTFGFATTIRIRITDLNYGGHVGNDSFLSILHEARQQFFAKYGYAELDIEGIGVIMVDSAIEYKREINYNDEVKISIAATGFDKLGFDLYYKLEVLTPEGPVLAGKAKTGLLCYDYQTKRKVPVPAEFLEKLSKEL